MYSTLQTHDQAQNYDQGVLPGSQTKLDYGVNQVESEHFKEDSKCATNPETSRMSDRVRLRVCLEVARRTQEHVTYELNVAVCCKTLILRTSSMASQK